MRPAPTIVAAVAVMVSGAVAVSVLGLQSSMPLSFLGAAVGLTFAVWRRPTRGESTLIRRLGHGMLAVSLSVTAVGLVLRRGGRRDIVPGLVPSGPTRAASAHHPHRRR